MTKEQSRMFAEIYKLAPTFRLSTRKTYGGYEVVGSCRIGGKMLELSMVGPHRDECVMRVLEGCLEDLKRRAA